MIFYVSISSAQCRRIQGICSDYGISFINSCTSFLWQMENDGATIKRSMCSAMCCNNMVFENLTGGDYRRDRRGQNIALQICGLSASNYALVAGFTVGETLELTMKADGSRASHVKILIRAHTIARRRQAVHCCGIFLSWTVTIQTGR